MNFESCLIDKFEKRRLEGWVKGKVGNLDSRTGRKI